MRHGTRVIAEFVPQAWMSGHAVEVDRGGDTRFDVTPVIDRLGRTMALSIKDNRSSSDALRLVASAPEWVREWGGPFYIRVEASIAEYYENDREGGERTASAASKMSDGVLGYAVSEAVAQENAKHAPKNVPAVTQEAGGVERPIVVVRDESGDDRLLYLFQGAPGMSVARAEELAAEAVSAARTTPHMHSVGETFEDLEREMAARGLNEVPRYCLATARW